MAARAVHILHWFFLLFVLAGWILPWKVTLIAHLFIIPGLLLHWRTNNNRCILTEVEERLKTSSGRVAPREEEAIEDGQFIKGIITRLTGQKPSDKFMSRLIYGVMVLVWILSASRLFNAAQAS